MNNRQQAREEALFVLLMEQVARQQAGPPAAS